MNNIKQALESAIEFVDRHSEDWYNPGQELLSELKAALAELDKREPVAIVDEVAISVKGKHIFNAVGKVNVGDKLYLAPPQQQWVGLSAEKRAEILDEFSLDSEWSRSKAIEAELKQLNTKG